MRSVLSVDSVSIYGRYPTTGLASQLALDIGLYLYNNKPAGTYQSVQVAIDQVIEDMVG